MPHELLGDAVKGGFAFEHPCNFRRSLLPAIGKRFVRVERNVRRDDELAVSSSSTVASITVMRPDPPMKLAAPTMANVPGSGIRQLRTIHRATVLQ